MSQYDPGEPYDGPPPRRRKRREYQRDSEMDDAWAAASDDALDDGDLAVEDLAAGYLWEDRDRYGVNHDEPDGDDNALPAAPRGHARPPLVTGSPTYHRDHARRAEYGEYWDSTPTRRQPSGGQPTANPVHPASRRGLPYWQVLMLVILGLFAVLAVVLACVSVLVLL